MLKKVLWACALVFAFSPAKAETVEVKYVGPVDLADYRCVDTDSSFVHRVCHDADRQLMVIRLKETYYQYCRIGADVVGQLTSAPSVGRFYNSHIKSSANGGQYDCRG